METKMWWYLAGGVVVMIFMIIAWVYGVNRNSDYKDDQGFWNEESANYEPNY